MSLSTVEEVYFLYTTSYKGNLPLEEFSEFWHELGEEERLLLADQFEAGRPYLNNPMAASGGLLHPLMALRMLELAICCEEAGA